MKIYFAGSIRGGRENKEIYFSIIEILQKYGEVLTEHLGDSTLDDSGETKMTDKEIYERDMEWVKMADMVVADVSSPSLGVGYEIGQAQSLNKNIICLYKNQGDKLLSAMISGNEKLKTFKYSSMNEVEKILESELSNFNN